MEFPKMLFVIEETEYGYGIQGLKQLVGKHTLESAVPDNGSANLVAIYTLVSVDNYKKVVTRTATVEKV